MGVGTKKAIVKRQKIKTRVCYRDAELATATVSQCSMSLISSRGGRCRFSISQLTTGKRNPQKKEKAFTIFFFFFFSVLMYILSGSSWVAHSSGIFDMDQMHVQCRLINIRKARAPIYSQVTTSGE